jgi:outer membrane protein assembly factor BamB
MQRSASSGWVLVRRWGLLGAVVAALPLLLVSGPAAADGEEESVLLPARPMEGASCLAAIGENQLARLPWDPVILRANLSADRPVAVAGAYLMGDDLLCVTSRGAVYCLSRRDLTPRWVVSLKAPLAQPPAEGPTHYAFIVQSVDGAYWLHAFAKRNGAEGDGFPARLPFAVSSGCSANASHVFVASLGSPQDAKTVVAYGLADGRSSWGYRSRGLVWATPTVDPSGKLLVIASESGATNAVSVGSVNMGQDAWALSGTAPISASPAVTPSQVVLGSQDGVLRCADLGSGEVLWLEGLGAPIEKRPWVLGGWTKTMRSTGVEGAAEVAVDTYTGIAFTRTRQGLYAHDLTAGTPLFREPRMSRPVCRQGRWILTMDLEHRLLLRDAEDGYKVKGRMDLRMFDLIPTNETSGQIFGITHDGMVVAASPR